MKSKAEVEFYNNVLSHIDGETIYETFSEDPYFREILKSLIEYVEEGNIDGIKLTKKQKSIYYRVSYIENGEKYRRDISLTRKIKNLKEKGASLDEAILKIKIEILKECFSLRAKSIIEKEEQLTVPEDINEFYDFLTSSGDGTIRGITIETDERYAGIPILFRIRTYGNEGSSTNLKVHFETLNDDGELVVRDFRRSLSQAIKTLLGWYGKDDFEISMIEGGLMKKSLDKYYSDYDNHYKKYLEQKGTERLAA